MTRVSRRRLLGLGGAAALGATATAVAMPAAEASASKAPPKNAIGMLYDTTRCIGCNSCVVACAETNGLSPPTQEADGRWIMPRDLNPETKNIIQLFRDDAAGQWSFVKRQCMHCIDPACVSGCPFQALTKDERGIVRWNEAQCIGCRYCEVACPFEVPKFQWDRFNPAIVKCEFCAHVLDEQGQPSCTKVCPAEAVIFGTREALLEDAHARLEANPGRYHEERVYGEDDAGGLQVLYLSHVPFEKIGLPKLGKASIPGQVGPFHTWATKWGVFPVLAFAALAAFVKRTWSKHDEESMRIEAEGGPRDQL